MSTHTQPEAATKPFNTKTEIEGFCPNGCGFTIRFNHLVAADGNSSKIETMCLEYAAHGEIGPIGMSLQPLAPYGEIFHDLTRHGSISEKNRRFLMV